MAKEIEEKVAHIHLRFTIGWNIIDFEDGVWPSDENLIKSSIEQVKFDYLRLSGHERLQAIDAEILPVGE